MDLKKLKYMKKLAMKCAKYEWLKNKCIDASWEAEANGNERKYKRLGEKAKKYDNKQYYIKEVYDLEVNILGSIYNTDTQWDKL